MTREELVNSREYKIAGAALNDISNIDEEYADNEDYIGGYVDGFENGAMWADAHPFHDKTKKPKWSEEDSLMIDSIIDTIKWLEGKGATNMKIDWLKSLKQRMEGQQ